ncbi:ubiquitin-conjugating enzyme/RWD-like protein [Tricladium varicosporioides]|nr:ubiquitin-conjugating enzyme/RWD-like protein [Hymenoscyphus varicosporioides]
MATPRFNSKSPTIKRILREAAEIASSPSPDYHASPASDADLFEWHFTLRGPPSSPFSKGIYHGRIVLPPTYPLRPPSFRFLTPSGRFEVNREICLSISGHHEETWQPAWGIRTALVALRSFMETDAKGQLGGLETSGRERERIAEGTGSWKCGICGRSNVEILEETANAAKEKEAEGEKVEEVVVPGELRMGFKDEMGKEAEGSTKAEGKSTSGASLENTPTMPTAPVAGSSTNSNPYPPAKPAQSVPQPTASSSSSQPRPQTEIRQRTQPPPSMTLAGRQAQIAQQRSNDGVPMWIDRAIAGVVVLLAAMVLKVLLGL